METMEFDSADVAGMFANGTWTNVILHEMGHILGIGTLWNTLGLKNGSPGDYIGANALREYRTLSGTAVRDVGAGRARWRLRHRDAHWDEDASTPS